MQSYDVRVPLSLLQEVQLGAIDEPLFTCDKLHGHLLRACLVHGQIDFAISALPQLTLQAEAPSYPIEIDLHALETLPSQEWHLWPWLPFADQPAPLRWISRPCKLDDVIPWR